MIRVARRRWHPLQFLAHLNVALAALQCGACAADTGFSVERARPHVRMLADTIGCRPAGSEANRRAREYVAAELRRLGFEVRIQEAEASRPELGVTTRVFNVIAVKHGTSPDAVALVAHYDSPPESVGAADDGLGVAVVLEAARVLAGRDNARWTLVAAVTDAEELGLMGARALVHDPVMARVKTYLNLEAAGTTGPSLLFQTGPGNAWLVKAWAGAAPSPAGNSITTEIYERLPNDTDFTVISQLGIPGLNFAPVGYSEVYHTPRDAAANLSDRTLQTTGDNVVSIVRALDDVEIGQRAPAEEATYFDIVESVGVAYGPMTTRVIAWLAVVLGVLAWLKTVVASRRISGLLATLLGFPWALVGVALVALAMVGATWLLRLATGWLHPWYARPGVFLLLLAGSALLAAWATARLALAAPRRMRGCGEPVCVWVVVLPLWIALVVVLQATAPGAGFALAWPLLAAGACLVLAPLGRDNAPRLASFVVLVVAALLTTPSAVRLLFFASPMFGRLPIAMPVYVYAALVLAFAVPVVPPLLATLPAPARRALASGAVGVALAAATVTAFVAASLLAGYSQVRPHLRAVRYVSAAGTGDRTPLEYWEVGGNEPGPHLGLLPGGPAPGTWHAVADGPPLDVPVGRLRRAYVSRTERPASTSFPGTVASRLDPLPDGTASLSVRIVPESPTATISLVLPVGIVPSGSNYPGSVAAGRWRAGYIAAPPGGVEFRVELGQVREEALGAARVVIIDSRLPGGRGWQALPPWLPVERDAWTARSVFIAGLGPLGVG